MSGFINMVKDRLKSGIVTENPLFVQVMGTCPTLAVSSSVENALGMGAAATLVLMGSNVAISSIRKLVPDQIRIPVFIIVIAAFVTVVQMLMQGYLPELNRSLGIFIPLIVVNCIILGRAEAYASKNKVLPSLFDAIGEGLGFMVALVLIATVREVFGAGTFLGVSVMPASYEPALLLVLAPGAFLVMGGIMGIINAVNIRRKKKTLSPCEGGCASCPLKSVHCATGAAGMTEGACAHE